MTTATFAAIAASNAANASSNYSGGEITQEQAMILLGILGFSLVASIIMLIFTRDDWNGFGEKLLIFFLYMLLCSVGVFSILLIIDLVSIAFGV